MSLGDVLYWVFVTLVGAAWLRGHLYGGGVSGIERQNDVRKAVK